MAVVRTFKMEAVLAQLRIMLIFVNVTTVGSVRQHHGS